MSGSFGSRLQHAWNAFMDNAYESRSTYYGMTSSFRPDRPRLSRGNERSIITSVLTRIAIDTASLTVQHVKLDENGRFASVVDDGLNECLTTEANIDQTGRAYRQDVVMSMLDEGCVAMVPIDTSAVPNPDNPGSYDIGSIRTGKILEWRPSQVRVDVYNDHTGSRQSLWCPKRNVGIVENPLYSVMNEPNSTLQRLVRKLILLDAVDEEASSGKLDLIIQLPYVIKTEARKKQAEERRNDIVNQLAGSKYGIAYTDGTEHITQLNRPVENNLMAQITYLTSMLYSQLGITQAVMDGTADEKTMLNYFDRTIEPIISTIVDEMKRKFLTKTARTQGHSIMFFRDPFKLVPAGELADIADKFTRNEIVTPNEFRQAIGMKPSDDPNADVLKNRNIASPAPGEDASGGQPDDESDSYSTDQQAS